MEQQPRPVPSRLAADNHVASVLVVPFAVSTDSTPRRYSWPEIEVVRLASLNIASPGLRAPAGFNL